MRFRDTRPETPDGHEYLALPTGAIIADALRDMRWSTSRKRTGARKQRSNPAKRAARDAAYGGYKMTRAMWMRHHRLAKDFIPWNELTPNERRLARNARKQERRERRGSS